MACCVPLQLCDPTDNRPIVGSLDTSTGVATWFEVDGTAYAGDPALLIACVPDVGDPIVSPLVDNGDGTYTYTDEDGVVTIIEAGDPCSGFDEAPIACDAVTAILASDGTDCGPIDPCDLIPAHTFASCMTPGQTISAAPVVGAPPTAIQSTELDRGQVGTVVYGDEPPFTHIPVGTFPLTITVPPANPDCVLALHVVHGGYEDPDNGLWGSSWEGASLDTSNTSDISAPKSICESYGNWPNDAIGQNVWIMDPLTGNGGSTIDLDFTKSGDNGSSKGAVLQWYWSEICEPTGIPLNCADFDVASLVEETVTNGGTSADIDLGDCPATYFAAGRHVLGTNTGGAPGINEDVDWFVATSDGSGLTETYDTNSFNTPGAVCQIGSAHGVVDAGTGSWTYDHMTNSTGQGSTPIFSNFCGLPLLCNDLEPAAGGGTSDSCEVTVTNSNCNKDGVVRCSVQASITICGDGDFDHTVTPLFNGVPVPYQTVGLSSASTSATGETCSTYAVAFSVTDFANVLAPGASVTNEFAFDASATGDGSFELSDWTAECEVIHI